MRVTQNEEKPVSTEIIADAIVEIAKGVQRINQGKLNQKAIVLLVHHACGVSQRDVKKVLEGLDALQAQYIKKSPR